MYQEAAFGILGLSGIALFLMRALADMLSILVFAYVVIRNIVEHRPFPVSGIGYERFFFLFLVYSVFISVLSLNSGLGTNFSEILVLNRFVFLAISIPFIVTTVRKVERLINFLWVMVIIQLLLGLAQAIAGEAVVEFFKPNDYSNFIAGSERSFTSNRGIERRMLIGSLGDFISYGYILFFGLILLMSRATDFKYRRFLSLLMLVMIFLAGSRIIFLASLLVWFTYLFIHMTLRGKLATLFSLTVLLPPVLFLMLKTAAGIEFEYNSFLSLFKPEFIQALMSQRLGHLLLYLPQFFSDPVVVIGLSPDKSLVEAYAIEKYGDVLPYIFLATFAGTLEDFYPAALISYYGLIGSALFYAIYFLIMRAAWVDRLSSFSLLSRMSHTILLLGFSMHALSLGNQSFENRGLSLVFWISVGLYSCVHMISKRSLGAAGTTATQIT